MSTIPLAKGRNDTKRSYPGYLSVKLDGVPIRLDIIIKDNVAVAYGVQSRQGKPVPSVEPQVQAFLECMNEVGLQWQDGPMTLVFEVTHKTLRDFKDISGVVRKQEPQQDLILNLFDATHHKHADAKFDDRVHQMGILFQHMHHEAFRLVPQFLCENQHQATYVEIALLDRHPDCEGLIWRDADATFKPGKRSWDYQKLLNEPTVDLYIIGFEEAVCGKTGAGKGMVGGLIANYKGTQIGVGPGKLTHRERKELFTGDTPWGQVELVQKKGLPGKPNAIWYQFSDWGDTQGTLAQIKHKRDPSYEALRQPTWQHWRLDKSEESLE